MMQQQLLVILIVLLLAGCGSREPAMDIWTAAATGNTDVIKQQLELGTDPEVGEPAGGSSPLIVAALYGQTAAMKLLLESGANADSTNNDGSTALHTAAFFCHPDAVALLLEHGANTAIRNKFERTALESVSGEWNDEVAGRYTAIAGALQLPIDLARVQSTRPKVADLIRRHSGH